MQYGMYAVFDAKAEVYSQPFFSPNNQTAIRHFKDMANTEGTLVSKNPNDFGLWRVGTFDDATGMIGAPDENNRPLLVVAFATQLREHTDNA